MIEVVEGLYISSLDAASDVELRRKHSITHVVSLGCLIENKGEDMPSLEYPDILDTPSSLILPILKTTGRFIREALIGSDLFNEISSDSGSCRIMRPKGAVLVHCIYGQSRSATVIAAYLFDYCESVHKDLTKSLEILRSAKPDICINPGFLSQLHLYSTQESHTAEVELMKIQFDFTCAPMHSVMSAATREAADLKRPREPVIMSAAIRKAMSADLKRPREPVGVEIPNKNKVNSIICTGCKSPILDNAVERIVIRRYDASFVAEHLDSFWRGYPAPSESKQKTLDKLDVDSLVLSTLPGDEENHFMLSSDMEGDVYCCNCKGRIGCWRKEGLAVAGGFVSLPLIALNKKAVILKTFTMVNRSANMK